MIRASRRPIVTLPIGHAVCPRCAVIREVRAKNRRTICRDCKEVLTPAERKAWAA